jgi:predicted transcriptional regulator
MSNTKPMTKTQRVVLRALNSYRLFPGYCELMLDTGLKSYKAVDWVLDALERRELVKRDGEDYVLTEKGLNALAAMKVYGLDA